MIKQASIVGIMITGLLLLQATILPIAFSAAVKPDLLLIFTVSCGLLFGSDKAVGIGFFSGLLQDLASGNIFGTHVLAKMAIGYFAGLAEKKVFKEHIFLPMVAMLAASILNSAILITLLTFLGHRIGLNEAIAGEVMPALIYNVLFSVPVHQAVYRIAKRWD